MGVAAMKYAIVIEHAGSNYSAYVPDLPGCVATGRTVEDVRERLAEAVALHLDGMREDGDAIPPPTTVCEYMAVA
jgi:predicted RNase H-like HicB family nuclease